MRPMMRFMTVSLAWIGPTPPLMMRRGSFRAFALHTQTLIRRGGPSTAPPAPLRRWLGSQSHSCLVCGEEFPSRNGLFTHIRHEHAALASSTSTSSHATDSTSPPQKPTRVTALMMVTERSYSPGALAEVLHEAVVAVCVGNGGTAPMPPPPTSNQSSSSSSPSSWLHGMRLTRGVEARFRPKTFQLAEKTPVVSDVAVCSLRVEPSASGGVARALEQGLGSAVEAVSGGEIRVLGLTVEEKVKGVAAAVPGDGDGDNGGPGGGKARAAPLHAERDATQRIAHYLLPIEAITNETLASVRDGTAMAQTTGGQEVLAGWRSKSRRQVFKRLKQVLKAQCGHKALASRNAEARTTTSGSGRRSQEGEASCSRSRSRGGHSRRRFGALGLTGPEQWHNYAPRALSHLASPQSGAVRASLDRLFVVGSCFDAHGNEFVVVEARGDHFLDTQVCRLVGIAVAVMHGLLPESFTEISKRTDLIIETPIAPPHLMYADHARYDFYCAGRGALIEDEEALRREARTAIQEHIISATFPDEGPVESRGLAQQHQGLKLSTPTTTSARTLFLRWLYHDLPAQVIPRIQRKLRDVHRADAHVVRGGDSTRGAGGCGEGQPDMSAKKRRSGNLSPHRHSMEIESQCHQVLGMLRAVDRDGKWPQTSEKRARVIRRGTNGDSFSVGLSTAGQKRPIGTTRFPELTNAVFELERTIAPERPPSTMCAINRNAQFTPHVDSGAGAGQSTSLIIGLGEYTGGELVVEGELHDIRYQPLEFDGWHQRHWTSPFHGERYSLVFFTPAEAAVVAPAAVAAEQ